MPVAFEWVREPRRHMSQKIESMLNYLTNSPPKHAGISSYADASAFYRMLSGGKSRLPREIRLRPEHVLAGEGRGLPRSHNPLSHDKLL
ncbi:MAG: hypothetical protein WC861_02115 [Candidatus Micrarchaeia archaeon]